MYKVPGIQKMILGNILLIKKNVLMLKKKIRAFILPQNAATDKKTHAS